MANAVNDKGIFTLLTSGLAENGKEPEVTYEERYRGFTVRAVTE